MYRQSYVVHKSEMIILEPYPHLHTSKSSILNFSNVIYLDVVHLVKSQHPVSKCLLRLAQTIICVILTTGKQPAPSHIPTI